MTAIKLLQQAIPPRDGQKVCYMNLTAKGCSGGANKCVKRGFFHFVPKKADISQEARAALAKQFGELRTELA